jgi:hypothetical protein
MTLGLAERYIQRLAKRRSRSIGPNSNWPADRCARPLRVLGRASAQTLTIDQAPIPAKDRTATTG